MTKKVDDQRKQPEFLFVFNNKSDQSEPGASVEQDSVSRCHGSLAADVAQAHRDKLLAELHEYGC